MSNRRFLLTSLVGLVVAAAFLALAAALDNTGLAVAGAVLVFVVLVAKEAWTWAGDGRLWLRSIAGLGLVVAAAFAFQTLTG